MKKHEKEAKKTIRVFKFIFFVLFLACLSSSFLLKGRASLVSGDAVSFGTASASVPCLGLEKVPAKNANSDAKTAIQAEAANVVNSASKPAVPAAHIVGREVVLSKQPISTVRTARSPKRSKMLTVGHKKTLFKEKYGWFLAMACKEEGLDISHVDTLISLGVHESGVNPYAKNDSSSAAGIYQFITATGVNMAEELGLDPEYYNPMDPYLNIRMGVKYYKKNLDIYKSAKWAILAHYTGTYAARDTAAFYGGVNKTPFVRLVTGVLEASCDDPPQWAMAKWRKY